MGGDIKVESVINKGTTFSATIKKNKSAQNNIDKRNSKTEDKISFKVEEDIDTTSEKTIYLLNNDPVKFLSFVTRLNKDYTVKQASTYSAFLLLVDNALENDLLLIDLDEKISNSIKDINHKNIILIYDDEELIKEIDSSSKTFFKKSDINEKLLPYIKDKLWKNLLF